MWTKEKLVEEANKYLDNCPPHNNSTNQAYISGFLAGCNYIIDNTQKYENTL